MNKPTQKSKREQSCTATAGHINIHVSCKRSVCRRLECQWNNTLPSNQFDIYLLFSHNTQYLYKTK